MSKMDFSKYKPALHRFLNQHGIETNIGNVRCISPNHRDSGPSMQINADNFYCHGCGCKGDIYDAVEYIAGITDIKEQFKYIENVFGSGEAFTFTHIPAIRQAFTPDPEALEEIRAYCKEMRKTHYDKIMSFSLARGYGEGFAAWFGYWPGLEEAKKTISIDTLEKAGIPLPAEGQRYSAFTPPGVIMRLAKGFQLCYQKYDDESGKTKTIKRKSYGAHAFPFPSAPEKKSRIILTEGELGAIACREAGILEACAMGGINGLDADDIVILKGYKEIILLGNNDDEAHERRGQVACGALPKPSGHKFKLSYEKIIEAGFEGILKCCVPETEKDEDDLLKNGKKEELLRILKNAKPIDRAILPATKTEVSRIADFIKTESFRKSFGVPIIESLKSVPSGSTIETTHGYFEICAKNLNVKRIFTEFENNNQREVTALWGKLVRNEDKDGNLKGVKRSAENCTMIATFDSTVKFSCALSSTTLDIEFNKRAYPDFDSFIANLKTYFSKHYGIELSEIMAKDVIVIISRRNCFNPITDFINGIKAPDKNPLPDILKYITFQEGISHALMFELFDLFFKKMFINILKTDYQHETIQYKNDCVLILSGSQGTGKSTLIENFGLHRFYYDIGSQSQAEITGKDNLMSISGVPVIELGELSTMSKSTIESIKSFLSKFSDKYRKPYARDLVTVPRISSFIGSSNDVEYLTDKTGNRRFYPVEIVSIDMDGLFNKQELFINLWAWYGTDCKKYFEYPPDEVNKVLMAQNKISEELAAYLSGERLRRMKEGEFDEFICEYIDKIEHGNFEGLGRSTNDVEKYLSFTECVIYTFGDKKNSKTSFNRAFSQNATMRGYTKGKTRVPGKDSPINVWRKVDVIPF